jgi:hypothetical protein
MEFSPNRKFKKQYRRIFRRNPGSANLYLMLCELADRKGKVKSDERELARLMAIRFSDLKARQL